jgi:hypothetical protein
MGFKIRNFRHILTRTKRLDIVWDSNGSGCQYLLYLYSSKCCFPTFIPRYYSISGHPSRRYGSKKVWPYFISGHPLTTRSWFFFISKHQAHKSRLETFDFLIHTPKIFTRNEPQVKVTLPLQVPSKHQSHRKSHT